MAQTLVAEKPATSEDISVQIETAFKRLHANRWHMANTTAEERIARLKRLRDAILRRRGELEKAMWEDFHKPAAEVTISELQPVLSEIQHTIKHLKSWMKPMKVPTPMHLFGTKGVVKHEPKGTVLILSPWNYPFNLFINPLVTAISAGNVCMMRPSDKVRATSTLLKSLIEEVFPPEEVVVFTGPSSIGNIMLEMPFDHVFFTGSPNVGRTIMSAASKHLASVTLELGGQSPVVVDESADEKAAAQRLMWGKFVNGGQTCIAPNHVFVHESKLESFLEEAKASVERQYGATDADRKASADFARIVDDRSHKRLAGMLESTIAAGAKVVVGGDVDASERYIAPTVLRDVDESMAAMDEEIFGPILPIMSYKTLDQVIAAIQSRPKPLAMYIFSNNQGNIDRLLANTTAGGTTINNVLLHFANGDLPFGGVGESGQGNYHGFFGFRNLSHERAVLVQKKPVSINMFFPPYTDKVKKMGEMLTKYLAR